MSCALELNLLLDTQQVSFREVCESEKQAAAKVAEVVKAIESAKDRCTIQVGSKQVYFSVEHFRGFTADTYGLS